MSMTDPLADMLARINNGQRARLAQVACPASGVKENVLKVLKEEGYIRDFAKDSDDAGKPVLYVGLKYHEGEPVIKKLRRISTPGCRVYKGAGDLPRIYNGLGTSIISTSKGVMSDYQARVENVGGEVLCEVA